MKEEEEAAKEALNAAALAQFVAGPGGRHAGADFQDLGDPGDHGDGKKGGMDPGNEAQAPIGGIQADNAGADGIEAHGPFQQRARKGGIMHIGRREQVENGQAGAATKQGMHPIAARASGADAAREHDPPQHQGRGGTRPGWGRYQ